MTLKKDPEGNETKFLHEFVDFTDKRALEIGCGAGRLTWRYARSVHLTMGIDPNEEALREAAKDRPADLQRKAMFIQGSSLNLPFQKETFDIALLAWSL